MGRGRVRTRLSTPTWGVGGGGGEGVQGLTRPSAWGEASLGQGTEEEVVAFLGAASVPVLCRGTSGACRPGNEGILGDLRSSNQLAKSLSLLPTISLN